MDHGPEDVDLEIVYYHDGSIVLFGGYITTLADVDVDADLPMLLPEIPFHVILFTASEVEHLSAAEITQLLDTEVERPVVLGLGRYGDAYYRVLSWSQGTILRYQHRRPSIEVERYFYISLDARSLDKGTTTRHLCVESIIECAILGYDDKTRMICGFKRVATVPAYSDSADEYALFFAKNYVSTLAYGYVHVDDLWQFLRNRKMSRPAEKFLQDCYARESRNMTTNRMLGDSLMHGKGAKRAMFHYGAAALHAHEDILASMQPTIVKAAREYAVLRILDCWKWTELGPLFREHEIDQRQDRSQVFDKNEKLFDSIVLRSMIQKAYANRMNAGIRNIRSFTHTLPSFRDGQNQYVPYGTQLVPLPWGFSWLVPFRLAFMSGPTTASTIVDLNKLLHVKTVVTLGMKELPTQWFTHAESRNIMMPICEDEDPTVGQVSMFIDEMAAMPPGEGVVLHCDEKRWHSGVVAACYLMACGFECSSMRKSSFDLPRVLPSDAIRLIRHMRPGSINTPGQVRFVKDFDNLLTRPVAPARFAELCPAAEPNYAPDGYGDLSRDSTFIVCCGLPGSGKSTFAAKLTTSLNFGVITVHEFDTDKLSSVLLEHPIRGGYQVGAIAHALDDRRRVVVDFCNLRPEDRYEWLGMANSIKGALCVWFDIDPETCIKRISKRPFHTKQEARNIVQSALRDFVRPICNEKFGCVARIKSTHAVTQLLEKLTPNT